MAICKRVLYSGHVQGVGFRYSTLSVAQRFTVTGFVRNLPDGRVELTAEGEAGEVERFLAAVAEHMADYIRGQDVRDEPPAGYTEFTIRR